MTRAAQKLLDQALDLPKGERKKLAQWLLDSLEPARDPFFANRAIEKAWAAEIDRRSKEIDEGTVKLTPWSVVRRDAERRIDESRRLRPLPGRAPRLRRRR